MNNPHNFTFLSGDQDLFNRTSAYYEKSENYMLPSIQGLVSSKLEEYIYDEDDLAYAASELEELVSNASEEDAALLNKLLICVCGYSLDSLNVSDLPTEIHENISNDDEDPYDQSLRFMKDLMDDEVTAAQVEIANSFFSLLCESSPDQLMCELFNATQIFMDMAKNKISEAKQESSNSL